METALDWDDSMLPQVGDAVEVDSDYVVTVYPRDGALAPWDADADALALRPGTYRVTGFGVRPGARRVYLETVD